MADTSYDGEQYKLRAGSPMPTGNGNFKLHTFMAEKIKFTNYMCKTGLPSSSDFRGNGGDYSSAQFNRLGIVGEDLYSGKVTFPAEYINEDTLGFNY